jgi:Fur family zinc uptake transcriptional regulator
MMAARPAEQIEAQLDEAAAACALQSTQLTELRRGVLGLVLEADAPLTAYQLLDRLRETRKGAVPPTIYRALAFLLENRLIHKIESLNAFIPCVEAGHHSHAAQFLICRRCGTVAELEDHEVSMALAVAARKQGFNPGNAVVEIEGVCAGCSTPAAAC